MADSLRVRAISLVPPAYRTLVKELYGTRQNVLVYKLPRPGDSTTTRRVAFKFRGNTLVDPLKIMRQVGTDIAGKVQTLGWKIFPKDSRGNFLIYIAPDEIKLESDNNLVYRSTGIITTNSPGTIFVRATKSTAKDSGGSTFYHTTTSHALQSPGTSLTHANGCTTIKSRDIKIEGTEDNPCSSLTVNETQGSRIVECTASQLDKCIDTLLERCSRVKATLCKGLHVADTSDKDLKGLKKRVIKNGALELKWYEGIPIIGSWFKQAI
jgi:hypothetical protein